MQGSFVSVIVTIIFCSLCIEMNSDSNSVEDEAVDNIFKEFLKQENIYTDPDFTFGY